MPIPKEIIDNSAGNKLVSFLNEALRDNQSRDFDVATAFFDIKAFSLLSESLKGVKRFRLLLGKAPEIGESRTLGEALLEEMGNEVESFDLTKESEDLVKRFTYFLKRDSVEVRLYNSFLHGKAYIFDDRVVVGSSNFTAAGLTREGELNTWKQRSEAEYTRREWFEKFWPESSDFKEELIHLLEESRFGMPRMPYEIFIKSLYELQKEDIEREPIEAGKPQTKVSLTEFQADAIPRIETKLDRYGGCIVADSVGLGKTWIAKRIIEKVGYFERENMLIICPAQLKEMWGRELKGIDVKENIISQEDLASKNFVEKAQRAAGGSLESIKLVVVDESHNFRSPLSNRWENLFTLTTEHMRSPKMLFLTATPINNTIWDLYWQIMLLVKGNSSAFIKENIQDLFRFFKNAENNPSLLNDLLNEISIRRTRDYIIRNYPDAYIINQEGKEEKIIFPKRTLESVNYSLDQTYKGMYREISETIAEKLTMAYYRRLEYKKGGVESEDERFELGRMQAIGGIFRTILLKRLESSIHAFKKSISDHMDFLELMEENLKKGRLLTKEAYRKYTFALENELEDSEDGWMLEEFDPARYDFERLLGDIEKDISLLKEMLTKVERISPAEDSKLRVLKEKLLELSESGQTVLFTYYADTLNYIFEEIKKDERFLNLRMEAVSSSGITSKSPRERERIMREFSNREIDILLSTDVLSEGQNLQSARYLINYDLHWNPTRMIQRAGRIDRIGSPYTEIFIYNFFPENELEELLRLVQVLQEKIVDIDRSIGLDQSVLGEEIHPKVFGVLMRIKDKDNTTLTELEQDAFGGGEMFYEPLMRFLRDKGIEEIKKIPNGAYSGLRKTRALRSFSTISMERTSICGISTI